MALLTTIVGQMNQGYGDHMDGWDGHWWMIVPMTVFGVALLGVVVWAVVTVTRSRTPAADTAPSAREVLDQRYARGEIETADYEERKRLLG